MTADLFSLISDEHAQALVGGAANVAANFVNTWHGLGPDHQDGETGTASDRHGFADATAGGSGVNPTAGSNG